MLHDPAMDGDRLPVGTGDAIGGDHAGKKTGENKESEGIRTEYFERPRPASIAFDVDEPVAGAEDEQSETGGRENIGTRPHRFVKREIAVPYQADRKQNDAEEEHAGDFVEG